MSTIRIFIAALITGLIAAPFARADTLSLSSPDFVPGSDIKSEQVYNGSDCSGGNISPALSWTGTPAGTKSFAVTLFDPDAAGGGFWHWLIYNIPGNSDGLAKAAGSAHGAVGLQLANGFGGHGYAGPCPPLHDPAHFYVLTLYALDIDSVPVPITAQPAELLVAFNGHILAKTRLTVSYTR
jgi:Raf kinase inhibitor-like YbhB/YbcL family protein